MTDFIVRVALFVGVLVILPLAPWADLPIGVGIAFITFFKYIWSLNTFIPVDTMMHLFLAITIIETILLIMRLIGSWSGSVSGTTNPLMTLGKRKR